MALSAQRLDELKRLAARVRGHVLRAVYTAGAGHVGGPFSATDMLVALYFEAMRIDPARPGWPDRDRFILSKGHSAIAQYAIMAERGYFPVEELATFDSIDSRLQGHPDMATLPGLDMSSGSLGQGISGGVGIALGAKLLGLDFRTYVMLGDGESQEGQVWEASFVAARYSLDNLTAILDWNQMQQFGWQRPGGMLPPIEGACQRWQAFGWHTIEVDGHDIPAFLSALEAAQQIKGQPSVILAHTVKGKGVSFMENDPSWHARVPTGEELVRALAELGVEQEVVQW